MDSDGIGYDLLLYCILVIISIRMGRMHWADVEEHVFPLSDLDELLGNDLMEHFIHWWKHEEIKTISDDW